MTTNPTLPDTAFRPEYELAWYDQYPVPEEAITSGPAPVQIPNEVIVNPLDSIRDRLARLEEQMSFLAGRMEEVRYIALEHRHGPNGMARIGPVSEDPTDPDPEHVTAGEGDEEWTEDPDEIAYKTPWHIVAQTFNGSSNSGWRGFTSVYRDAHAEMAKDAVNAAIAIGLAISPDDPRLQSLVVPTHSRLFEQLTELAMNAYIRELGMNWCNLPAMQDAVAAVIAHLNATRSADR